MKESLWTNGWEQLAKVALATSLRDAAPDCNSMRKLKRVDSSPVLKAKPQCKA